MTGKLMEADTKGPAMEATVQLLALPDSTYVTGVASDGGGNFRLPRVKAGKYLLKVSYIGFKTLYKPLQVNTSRPTYNIGTLTLESDAIMLAEAVIVAEAPEVQVVDRHNVDEVAKRSAEFRRKMMLGHRCGRFEGYGAPDGIRTRVSASKGPNDWPLHYRSVGRPSESH